MTDARQLNQTANVDARQVHQKILNIFGQQEPSSQRPGGGGSGFPPPAIRGQETLAIRGQEALATTARRDALAIQDAPRKRNKKSIDERSAIGAPGRDVDPLPPPLSGRDAPTIVPKRKFQNVPQELQPQLQKIAKRLAEKSNERHRKFAPTARPSTTTKPFTGRGHMLGEDSSTAVNTKVIQTMFNKERAKPRREQHQALGGIMVVA